MWPCSLGCAVVLGPLLWIYEKKRRDIADRPRCRRPRGAAVADIAIKERWLPDRPAARNPTRMRTPQPAPDHVCRASAGCGSCGSSRWVLQGLGTRLWRSISGLLNTPSGPDRPTAVPFEGGSTLSSNDGGPQHSAGAQFADSIAVPGAAAVSNLRTGRLLRRAEMHDCMSDPRTSPDRAQNEFCGTLAARCGHIGDLSANGPTRRMRKATDAHVTVRAKPGRNVSENELVDLQQPSGRIRSRPAPTPSTWRSISAVVGPNRSADLS
jgi:hypothetical protein